MIYQSRILLALFLFSFGTIGYSADRVADSYTPDTISLDFSGESVGRILNAIAGLYEIKILYPKSFPVTQAVEAQYKDVNWRDAFDMILEPLGFTYIEEEGTVKIILIDHEEDSEFMGLGSQLRRKKVESEILFRLSAALLETPSLSENIELIKHFSTLKNATGTERMKTIVEIRDFLENLK